MKQYNATVLGKGQLVIPKEFRDELWIEVWDNLNCFVRWSAIILKKKIKTTTYSSMDDSWEQLPLWTDDKWEILSVSTQQFKWITCLLWKAGFGKSAAAINMMINMYLSGKSLIILDPYGAMIDEIKNYVNDLWDTSIYEYTLGWKTDRTSIKKSIKKNQNQKIIAIHINYQEIWSKKAVELVEPIIMDCYKDIIDANTAVFMDEFSAYYDEHMRSTIVKSPWYTCILDQGRENLSLEQISDIFEHINHIAIYQVWWLTAKYLVENLNVSHTIQELRSIEKYHFYFHSSVDKDAGKLLLGIYPYN